MPIVRTIEASTPITNHKEIWFLDVMPVPFACWLHPPIVLCMVVSWLPKPENTQAMSVASTSVGSTSANKSTIDGADFGIACVITTLVLYILFWVLLFKNANKSWTRTKTLHFLMIIYYGLVATVYGIQSGYLMTFGVIGFLYMMLRYAVYRRAITLSGLT